jgi:hypothetical protein
MSNIEQQIRETFYRAFFDKIEENINSETPDFAWIVSLYKEIKQRLLKFLKKDSQTYKQLDNDFDVPFFEQMLTNNVFDITSVVKLINGTFDWVQKLQAPYRDEETLILRNEVLNTEPAKIIPMFIQKVHVCLDNLDEDMSEFLSKKS